MTALSHTPSLNVREASDHLYQALTHHFGPLDLSAGDRVVRAVAEYGQRCREGDEEAIADASRHVYAEMTHHFGRVDFGAHDPVVKALAEYGQACRAEGQRAS
ncbi:MAG: hypothetical protein IT304_05700 [Dehalococcoidia bacterium]|nr:hypothetical protein [Dehalococcoidia bacterium]